MLTLMHACSCVHTFANARIHTFPCVRCKFALGSLELFEEKLEQAQRELGYAPNDFVPVK